MDDRTGQLLRLRAEQLARPLPGTAREGVTSRVFLSFSAQGGRYALPLVGAVLVRPLPEPAPVSDAPAWLVGLVAIAGRSLAAVDVGRFLDGGVVPAAPAAEGSAALVIVLEGAGLEAALLADAVEGLLEVAEAEIMPLPPGTSALVAATCEGLSGDYLLLSPARLLPALRAGLDLAPNHGPATRDTWPLPAAGAEY